MKKRGQITTFMIVGLVILIIFVLLFSIRRSGFGMKSQDYLESSAEDIKSKINDCVEKDTKEILNLLGKQGGYLNPLSYRMYNGYRVAYLCNNIPGTDQCANAMVNTADIEKQLADYLKANLPSCVNINSLGKSLLSTYDISSSTLDVTTSIQEESIIFEIDPKITLKKADATLTIPAYKKAVSLPLGLLLDTTYDIVNEEARVGVFFEVPYMLANRGKVEVFKDQPYPDKIYVLNARDSDYIFQFAIESEGENE